MRRVVLSATAIAVLASGLAASASVPASGLRGLVLLSPAGPVCAEGDPCTRPAAHVALVFSRNGAVVARIKTTANGRYRVRLAAGVYRVSTPAYRIGSGVTPKTLRVLPNRMRHVDLTIDTGIQ
jgi:hypothetical protein